MILYDKKSNFLGMGQAELSMLGYEDMLEFKNSCNDFADLFVQRPGYIFKFKNFSWIDYSLHSGAPNKNVIVKHKNGSELELRLKITEIFLNNPINEQDELYSIEIITDNNDVLLQPSATQTPIDSSFSTEPQDANESVQQPTIDDTKTETQEVVFPSDPIDNENSYLVDNEDFKKEEEKYISEMNDSEYKLQKEDNENFESPSLDDPFLQIAKTEESDIKLKIDDYGIKPKEEEMVDTEAIGIESEDLIDFGHAEEKLEIEKEPVVEKEPIIEKRDDLKSEPKNDLDIDFHKIADETGLDLNTIAILFEDFITESKKSVAKIESLSDRDEIMKEVIKLKGISESFKIDSLSDILVNVLSKLKAQNDDIEAEMSLFMQNIQKIEESIS